MNIPTHILVPYDNSDASKVALHSAVSLAKRTSAKLTAVYVKKTDNDPLANEVSIEIEQESKAAGIDILFLQPTGKMYREVVDTIEKVDADMIIMGSHGVSGFEEFWIGSNAYRVVSSASVPVITIQADFKGKTFTKLIVPIDQSKETRQKIPTVIEFARLYDSSIHLLGTTKYTDDESHQTVKRYLEQSREMLEKAGVQSSSSYSLGVNIAKATLDAAKEQHADLIVMMSESEPSSGLFMGSNAQQVVNHSPVPVLTLHPVDVAIGIAGY